MVICCVQSSQNTDFSQNTISHVRIINCHRQVLRRTARLFKFAINVILYRTWLCTQFNNYDNLQKRTRYSITQIFQVTSKLLQAISSCNVASPLTTLGNRNGFNWGVIGFNGGVFDFNEGVIDFNGEVIGFNGANYDFIWKDATTGRLRF